MPMSEEAKKALSERMKARHAAKKLAQEGNEAVEAADEGLKVSSVSHPEPTSANTISQDDYQALLKQIQELKSQVQGGQFQPAPQVGPRGLIGTYEKYTVDPSLYPDPCERLASEARLQRFAFRENYELAFQVDVTSYETKDGVNMREPRFTIELHRIKYDEDTGLPTDSRYVVCRAIFHEDPQAALVVARENGIAVDENDELAFLNEMRYIRMRDWLVEAFYPPKPSQAKQNKREEVIGGKLVEVFEINSETSESVPFNQIKKKG